MKRRELLLGAGAYALAHAQDLELSEQMRAAFGTRSGAAVLLDAARGHVIAAHRIDRAATRLASPGSVILPFTLLALIEAGELGRTGALRCAGGAAAQNGDLRCTHPRFNGPAGPAQALAWNCNSWFWQAAARLDGARFRGLLERFGFGSVSRLTPLENAGELSAPQSLEELRRMAVGVACVRITAAGLAIACRRLAMRRLKNGDPALAPLWRGLEEAVKSGSAQKAGVPGLSVAGKSGTGFDLGGNLPHAWFAGFAPAGAPRAVVSVFLERGNGVTGAAPIAGAILEAWSKRGGAQPR
jgi:cell division protein FtsI/penicillin-binding protein 2